MIIDIYLFKDIVQDKLIKTVVNDIHQRCNRTGGRCPLRKIKPCPFTDKKCFEVTKDDWFNYFRDRAGDYI